MSRRHPGSGTSGHDGDGPTSTEAGRSGVRQRIRKLLEEQDVTARIIQLVQETYGPAALHRAWGEFRCCDTEDDRGTLLEFSADCPFQEQFTSWLAYTWTPATLSWGPAKVSVSDQVPTQTFLRRHPDLDPLLVRYLQACIHSTFSFFEILSCEPGERFTCGDLLCGGRYALLEPDVSTLLQASQILYARLVVVDGVAVMDAAAPWPLAGEDLKPAILGFRRGILEQPVVEQSRALQLLRARELDTRSFYWGFIEGALWDEPFEPPGRSPRQH